MMNQGHSLILIDKYYGDKTAKRSGVPLMNHIYEGREILQYLRAAPYATVAFDLHPMFQSDEALAENHILLELVDAAQVALIMEYRNIANASLSDIVVGGQLTRPIKLSPLMEVNDMLRADKIQNRKDFELYHKGKHERSDDLDVYFRAWLSALGVSEQMYQQCLKDVLTRRYN